MKESKHIRPESEDLLLLRSILETAADGIITINQFGVIEMYNAASARLFGYAGQEVIGDNIGMLMAPSQAQKHDGYIERYLQEQKSQIIGIGREVMGRRKDGSTFPMRLAVSEVVLKSRTVFVGIIQNLSEIKVQELQIQKTNNKLEQKIRECNEKLQRTVKRLEETNEQLKKEIEEKTVIEERLRRTEADLRTALDQGKKLGDLKSRFVTMASHEFRTPLSTILASTELIEMYTKENDQGKRSRNANRIKSSVATLTSILSDFLSLSKLEEGIVRVQPGMFDLTEFCQENLKALERTLKPGQTINFHQRERHVQLNLDKKILKDILVNLLSNASKYSAGDSAINCKMTVKNGQLLLEIKDQGMGIPMEDQPHLFERFFRGHNVDHIQGTGLGLNIVKEYLDLLGGSISFKSKLGVGTTFYVSIPIGPPA